MPATYNMMSDAFSELVKNRSYLRKGYYSLVGEPTEIIKVRNIVEKISLYGSENAISAEHLCILCEAAINNIELKTYFKTVFDSYNHKKTNLISCAEYLNGFEILTPITLIFLLENWNKKPRYYSIQSNNFFTIVWSLSKSNPQLINKENMHSLIEYYSIFDWKNMDLVFDNTRIQADVDHVFSLCKKYKNNVEEARKNLEDFINEKFPGFKEYALQMSSEHKRCAEKAAVKNNMKLNNSNMCQSLGVRQAGSDCDVEANDTNFNTSEISISSARIESQDRTFESTDYIMNPTL